MLIKPLSSPRMREVGFQWKVTIVVRVALRLVAAMRDGEGFQTTRGGGDTLSPCHTFP